MNTSRLCRAALFVVFLFSLFICKAQTSDLGSWTVLNADFKYNDKWGAFFEGQLRSDKMYSQFFYHEMKGGISYKARTNVSLLVGSGQYATYTSGGNFKSPMVNHEFRIWEQVTLTNNLERFKIEHRYRIEQRFRTDGYRNRFRYRLNAIVPLNNPIVKQRTLYTSIYDEVFLTDKENYFERNRFFAGLGYQFNSAFTLQAGYIRQFDYSKTSKMTKNFIQTSLLFTFKHDDDDEHGRHPSSID